MAIGSTLPPQAYTRDILATAFNWLQTQPESTKRLASNPDALVGLYLRAQRFGASSGENDAPVSSQNFISDLRHLAEGLKQFDGDEEKEPTPAKPQSGGDFIGRAIQHGHYIGATTPTTNPDSSLKNERPSPAPTPTAPQFRPSMSSSAASAPRETSSASMASSSPGNSGTIHLGGLHANTKTMIHEVKSAFNLSSDAEAINLLVAIAYKNLNTLLI